MGLTIKCAAEDSPFGVEILQAYLRVGSLQVSKYSAVAMLEMYAAYEAYQNGARPLKQWGLSIKTSDLVGPVWPAVYQVLKQSYPESSDVIETPARTEASDPPRVVAPPKTLIVYPLQTPASPMAGVGVPVTTDSVPTTAPTT